MPTSEPALFTSPSPGCGHHFQALALEWQEAVGSLHPVQQMRMSWQGPGGGRGAEKGGYLFLYWLPWVSVVTPELSSRGPQGQ